MQSGLVAVETITGTGKAAQFQIITSYRYAMFQSQENARNKARTCLNDWQRYMPEENLKLADIPDHYHRMDGEFSLIR